MTGAGLAVFLFILCGCDGGQATWREYEEHTTHAASTSHAMASAAPGGESAAGLPLRWTAPAGWKASGASSMRLETFLVDRGGNQTGTCTIIKLGGAAGGVESNLKRWLGQINQPVPDADALAAFIAQQATFKTEGALECTLFDLTTLGTQAPDTPSMLVGLLPMGDMTVFAKLTGPVTLLQAERSAFDALCRSFRRGGE